jgi:hypothetical protein
MTRFLFNSTVWFVFAVLVLSAATVQVRADWSLSEVANAVFPSSQSHLAVSGVPGEEADAVSNSLSCQCQEPSKQVFARLPFIDANPQERNRKTYSHCARAQISLLMRLLLPRKLRLLPAGDDSVRGEFLVTPVIHCVVETPLRKNRSTRS